MCPWLWYLLAAAAVQPLLLHSVCHCVCHLFTLSITSSLCPALAQGQLTVWQTWPCKAHVLLWHSQGRRGTPGQNHPSWLSTALPPCRGQPTALALHGNRGAGGFCAALSSQWRELWNLLEPLTQTGAPGATSPQGHSPRVYSELLGEPQHTLHA